MPASLETARSDTRALFRTAWLADATSLAIPISWPNLKTKVDPAKVGTTNDAASWCRFSMDYVTGESRSIGSGLWRHRGLIVVEIYTPQGEGDLLATQLLAIARAAFQNKTTANGVTFFNIRPRTDGNSGLWYRVDLLAEFQHDSEVS